ncbi:leucine zipper domain-containing protein [Pseudarthrobacter sp. CC4]|uniref:helix-turn-helix domain-containing protein n=1 Tax=Pseudarthrobacter sp. CC4 TaxID=3029190 RepID=UPI003B8DAD3E
MFYRNARLTLTGRRILVKRVLAVRPIAHVAKEMGISRTCARRWISRYRANGWDGLQDRSSRAESCPHATPAEVVADVLTQRVKHREGPANLAVRCGTSARTVSRILARAGMPRLWDLDPITGARIRAALATGRRYERHAPGDMILVSVKKLGRIADGGGWRADPARNLANHRTSHQKLGFDYVHVAVDDYTRFAYEEVLPDEKGPTCAAFPTQHNPAFICFRD